MPHRCSADDMYKGYYIPKDSLVVGNSWCVAAQYFSRAGSPISTLCCVRAILHDEKAYPDPSSFNPDRFMKGGKINPDVRDPATAVFGYGRRICAGRHMAYESMWVVVASTLAAFNISKAKGSDGELVTPSGEYDLGFLWWVDSISRYHSYLTAHFHSYPKPFECDIQPRSAEHKLLVEGASHDIA